MFISCLKNFTQRDIMILTIFKNNIINYEFIIMNHNKKHTVKKYFNIIC